MRSSGGAIQWRRWDCREVPASGRRGVLHATDNARGRESKGEGRDREWDSNFPHPVLLPLKMVGDEFAGNDGAAVLYCPEEVFWGCSHRRRGVRREEEVQVSLSVMKCSLVFDRHRRLLDLIVDSFKWNEEGSGFAVRYFVEIWGERGEGGSGLQILASDHVAVDDGDVRGERVPLTMLFQQWWQSWLGLKLTEGGDKSARGTCSPWFTLSGL